MFYLEADHFISLPVVYWDSFLGDSSTYKAFAVPFLLLCHVRLFVTPWTVAHQTPLSMRILQAGILEWAAMLSSRIKFILSNHFANK